MGTRYLRVSSTEAKSMARDVASHLKAVSTRGLLSLMLCMVKACTNGQTGGCTSEPSIKAESLARVPICGRMDSAMKVTSSQMSAMAKELFIIQTERNSKAAGRKERST